MRLSRLLLFASVLLFSAHAQAQTHPPSPVSRPYELDDKALDAAIAGLNDPAQHYDSYRKIVLYYWSYPRSSGGIGVSYGDAAITARVARAGKAMGAAVPDLPLIKSALADPDPKFQWWAIGAAGGALDRSRGNDPRNDAVDTERLLPILEKFCTGTEEMLRGRAQNALAWFPSERDFLQKTLQNEISPENIMHLLTAHGLNPDYVPKMNSHLLRLLNSKEAPVRARAMAFIAWNRYSAEMFHCPITPEVRDKVLELSAQNPDRAPAVPAIAAIYVTDPTHLLALLKEMAADKNPEVRKQTSLVLYGNDKIPEFHALLLTMINDADDTARLFAIQAAGPETHLPELRALATSKDPEVADVASTILKSIEDRDKAR